MTKLLHQELREYARDMTAALGAMSETAFSPNANKSLRTFSAAEVAYYLGVTEDQLRKAHQSKAIPDVELTAGNRRRYRVEQMWQIREIFAKITGQPLKFLPGRHADTDGVQVWAFVNFKGGSAKTASAIHVSHALSLRGYRVLVVDCDPQASITTFFGYQPEIDFFNFGSLYDAIKYEDHETGIGPVKLSQIIKKSYFYNLDIVPGGIQVSEFETETPAALSRGELPIFFDKIRDALSEVKDDYDIVIMDCPPQLGYVTLSAICAAQNIIMTIIPERVDMASAAQFLNMASSLTEVLHENSGVGLFDNFKFLLSRYDTNVSTQVDLAEFMRELFGNAVMQAAFLKSSAVSEAGISQQSVLEVDLSSVNNRKTYERAINSVHGVTEEIERMIQANWGREL